MTDSEIIKEEKKLLACKKCNDKGFCISISQETDKKEIRQQILTIVCQKCGNIERFPISVGLIHLLSEIYQEA